MSAGTEPRTDQGTHREVAFFDRFDLAFQMVAQISRYTEDTPMDTSQDRVQVVWAETQQLTRYLRALPPAAWHRPSACERWQVRDVVVHLAACAEVC